ncbi:MAG: hypothetical protein K1X57_07095 [Gemmataceae bacterium]|nr:hypothetical protein [Gemmataceae bacterium]
MNTSTQSKVDFAGIFEGIRKGERAARDDLFHRLYDRIQRLTAVMMRSFPVVRQRREVASVSNDLVLKLMTMLESPNLQITTEGDFLRLTAHKLRHLLIDEAEKQRKRSQRMITGLGGPAGNSSAGGLPEPADTDSCSPADMEEWARFHAQVAALLEDELMIFEMHFFMDIPQAEIARALGWPPKQVSRKYLAAGLKLADYLPTIK